jgi:cobyrinic acid a,c-diamide synthase
VAPLLYGFKNFDPAVQLAGVIFNKVASLGHYQFLKEAAKDAGVQVLGYMPRDQRLAIESRHLGLHLPGENKNHEIVNIAADLIEEHVDLMALLAASKRSFQVEKRTATAETIGTMKIALARDEAFNFSYQANIDALKQLGELNFFSPLHDEVLPDADLVWLPGGYPELFTEQLAANGKMKQAITQHIEEGKPLIAECGGMMYLGKELITKDGLRSKMTGIFDYRTSFENSKLQLGYRKLQRDNLLLKGHEFHYSTLETKNKENEETWEVQTARQKEVQMPVFRYKNCWASYLHLYLGEPERMKEFIKHLSK